MKKYYSFQLQSSSRSWQIRFLVILLPLRPFIQSGRWKMVWLWTLRPFIQSRRWKMVWLWPLRPFIQSGRWKMVWLWPLRPFIQSGRWKMVWLWRLAKISKCNSLNNFKSTLNWNIKVNQAVDLISEHVWKHKRRLVTSRRSFVFRKNFLINWVTWTMDLVNMNFW